MSATLPAARPSATTYGPELSDSRVIVEPSRELAAASWNQVREDLAQVASTAPLAVVRCEGSPIAVTWAAGVASNLVTVTRLSLGTHEVAFDASLGVQVNAITATALEYPATFTGGGFSPGTSSLIVTFDIDVAGFCVVVY